MPHDPVKVEETRSWFRKAQDDLRAASVDMGAQPPLLEDALFHYQQAVEKAMKGYLTWHDRPFRKTHSLGELGVICIELDPGLESVLRRAVGLSEYATAYRYPGHAVPPTQDDVAHARELAEEVVSQLLARLPAEILPPSEL
jgi:HEPN domain-containing protein